MNTPPRDDYSAVPLQDAPSSPTSDAANKENLTDQTKQAKGRVALRDLPALVRFLEILKALLLLLAQIGGALGRGKGRTLRPWHLRVGRKTQAVKLTQSEVDALLQRQRDLKDMQKLAEVAGSFRLPESDFFTDPHQVEKLIRRILEENPPWLYVSRVLSGGEQGSESHSQEVVWREQETRELQEVTLFVPDENWRDLPLASMTQRPARHLSEVWQARLLDQILPPEVQIDRFSRGEILIPVRHAVKQRLEFKPEQRRMEITVRKPVPIPIETEGGSGRGGQLLYVLLDFSASMQGKSATLALAAISAAVRANMGQRDTRYLFRRYADKEEIWPRAVEPPLQARTVPEKDAFLDTILATNFKGGATHVNDALDVAVKDIEHLRREEKLEASLLLVTDGRAEILESTRLRLRAAGVKVHTVMVTPEKNPGMEAVSESFTTLDIHPELRRDPEGNPVSLPVAPELRPRRAYRI